MEWRAAREMRLSLSGAKLVDYFTHTFHMSTKYMGFWWKPPMRLLVTRKSR
jgi:hypothetical protein